MAQLLKFILQLVKGHGIAVLFASIFLILSSCVDRQDVPSGISISSITPSSGDIVGGYSVTISGSGFKNIESVSFNGEVCSNLNYSLNEISCTVPTSASAGKATIIITGKSSETQNQGFTYTTESSFSVNSFNPTSGALKGNTSLFIHGSGLTPDTTVKVGGISCTDVTYLNSNLILCITPANVAGSYPVTISDPEEGSYIAPDDFTYNPAPTITEINPDIGSTTGSTSVTITGTGFVSGAKIKFGQSFCTSVVVNPTSITCLTPPGIVGTTDVRIINTDQQDVISSGAFTYFAPPVLTSFSPTGGALAGGTSITLNGANFVVDSIASIDGIPCTSTTYVSASQLTCITPSQVAGTYSVMVTNPGGSTSTLMNSYTYRPSPTVDSISPNGGSINGGTSVTISGSGFIFGASVDLGGSACSGVIVVDSSTITCTTTAHIAEPVTVTVTNSDTQFGFLSSGYTYQVAPAPSTISPQVGSVNGNTSVTISGSDFLSGATVSIGGVDCSVTSFSTSSITCTTDSHAIGTVDVIVTNPDGQTGIIASSFSYLDTPTISTISPNYDDLSGGSTITITGANFFTGATVSIDGNSCTDAVVSGTTSITCTAPSRLSAGVVDLVVTNPDGIFATASGGFSYFAAPEVDSLSITAGALAGGTSVTITGSNFLSNPTVDFGGSACTSVDLVDSNTINCVTTAHAAGLVDVTVTNYDNQDGTLSNAYTYQAAPDILSLSPDLSPAAGGVTITITGTNFLTNATVTVGSVDCPVDTLTSTTITCTTGLNTAGLYDVVVTNPDTQFDTLPSSHRVLDPPLITNISPDIGDVGGGTLITITGQNFYVGPQVTIDGVSCNNIIFVDSTTITCSTPPHAAQSTNVIVTNQDGISDTRLEGFTYQETPVVSSVSPTNGPSTGGTVLTITGTGFQASATVSVGNNPCGDVVVVSNTSITCTTASHAAAVVDVTVTNPDTLSGSLGSGFTYDPAPEVNNVSPEIGSINGSTNITITGLNFVNGATVNLGGNACTGVTFVDSSTITCNTPGGSAGAVTVTVTNPDTQPGSLLSGFTYLNPPVVSGVSPSAGALSGGTTITISGTDFYSGASVTLDGFPCTSVQFVDSSTLTCVTPSHAAGAVDIIVTNPDNEFDTYEAAYTYQIAPDISYVTPNNGPMGGGTSVTVVGTGFVTGATVLFGTEPATCTVDSGVAISCTTPLSLVSGAVSVTVTNTDSQTDTQNTSFIYLAAPSISTVSPSHGPLAGGTSVTLSGSGFFMGATVTVGGVSCTDVTVNSSSSLTCTLPLAQPAGAKDVIVTNVDGQAGTLGGGYTYQGPPSVGSISPSNGYILGGTSVTITGSGFVNGATVQIGTAVCINPVVSNSTTITCTTGAEAAGNYEVTVTNSDGQSNPSSGLLFSYRDAPVVSSISPEIGGVAGGTLIQITGSGFYSTDTISIGASACNNITFISSTQMTCETPPQAAGSYDVTVASPDRQSTLYSGFSYLATPTVDAVTPSSGVQAGGTSVTISGSGFVDGMSVSFGAFFCTNVVVVNSGTITCDTTANSAGVVDVTVGINDELGVTLSNGYTYTSIPVLEFEVGASSPNPPNPDDYGTTSTNVTHTFTVKNVGEGASSSITTSVSGDNPAAWMITSDNCDGNTLAIDETCTIQLTFLGGFFPTGYYQAELNAKATSGGDATNHVQGTIP